MEFRIATKADADAIIAFDRVAASEEARIAFIFREIEASACYVTLVDGRVVAYAVLNYKFYDNGWMEMLYVDSCFRRRGVASSLVRYLIDNCRTPKLFTSTNQSNLEMQRLLEALGFSRSGTIENLDEDDPEWVYFKQL